MFKVLLIAFLIILPVLCFSAVKYGIGEWAEKGHGNHRAVISVTDAKTYNLVHIDWRRRDENPQDKALVIEDEKGNRVTDFYVKNINRIYGDVIFDPISGAGNYYIYYLPYNPGTGNFDSAGSYFKPENTASKQLAAKVDTMLPKATLVEIQARKHADRADFNSMYPMEVIASKEEASVLIKNHPSDFLLFPEDREHNIKMTKDLPLRWIENGPSNSFTGVARPYEYYVFQIGLFASKKDVKNVKIKFNDLKGANGSIKSGYLTCFNLGGINWKGEPFTKKVDVLKGRVQPLWIGVSVPKSAKGNFSGILEISGVGVKPTPFKININVAGAILEDRGDSDIFKLSRLRWLNDTIGISDTVPKPFKNIEVSNKEVKVLDRKIKFDNLGLPSSIISRDNEILDSDIKFVVLENNKPLKFNVSKSNFTTTKKSFTDYVAETSNDKFNMVTKSKTEFDGVVTYSIKLKAKENVSVDDIYLNIPMKKSIAKYMMGMGIQGGYRPYEWRWTWNAVRADHMLWIGDVNAGFQLMLRQPYDTWQILDQLDTGCPKSWDNSGRGGCNVTEDGNIVNIKSYSGNRNIKKGEELEFNFRLMITPFRPIDSKHWNYRYGDINNGGNISHFHHANPGIEYISYPFYHEDKLKAMVESHMNMVPQKALSYPAKGNFNSDKGTVHILATINFDPATIGGNQNLFSVDYPDSSQLRFYWNIDTKGMRSHVQIGPWQNNNYPYVGSASCPEWKKGDKVLLSFTWGEYMGMYVNGVLRGEKTPFKGTHNLSLDDAYININGPFTVEAVKITDSQYDGGEVDFTKDANTLLLEKIKVDENNKTNKSGVNIYYTVRELSNILPELYALKSLGDEVYYNGNYLVYSAKESVINQFGGGYPWLLEHLDSDYVPGWRQPLYNGETDAAIATSGLSRWHNYYVRGMDYLMKKTGIDGLYLDGIGYDREVMKRIARVMEADNPNYRINFHAYNCFDYLGMQMSPSNQYMEHVIYASNLWNGEMYDYDMPPEYWLVEISGIPYGNTAEMLNYETGGNVYRGMLYGMTSRQLPNVADMWSFWDSFGIQDAKWIGYWENNCPVKTDNKDVLATCYVKNGETLISIGSWAKDNVNINLNIDFKALGIDESKAKIYAPRIKGFQNAREFNIGDKIPVEKAKGWLLIVK